MSAKRSSPPTRLQVDVLIAQENRCLYCGNQFGDVVHVPRKGNVTLGLEWDHFVPYAYLVRNPEWNWVASCTLCNKIKSASMFPSVGDARLHIIRTWMHRGYRPAPINIAVLSDWLPGVTRAPNDDDRRETDVLEPPSDWPSHEAAPALPKGIAPPPSPRRNPQARLAGQHRHRQAKERLTALLGETPVRRERLVRLLIAQGTSPGLARSVVNSMTRAEWHGPAGWLRVKRHVEITG